MKRRTALGLMAAAPFVGGCSPQSEPRQQLSLDPTDPDDLYLIHRKVNYTFDTQPVFWYIEAVRYGLVGSQFTPFWNMHVAFLFTVESTGEFEFTTSQLSAIFYSDLETGNLLETFENPFTGASIPVRQPGLIRGKTRFNKARQVRAEREIPGATVTSSTDIGPAWIIGDDLWVHGDTSFRADPGESEGQLVQVNDWSTYHASLKEVADPEVLNAAATMNFNDINTWPAWLNMGEQPGNYVSRGFGRKARAGEDMPPQWRRFMGELYPAEFADLVSAIAG
jgi:hypothetical protein